MRRSIPTALMAAIVLVAATTTLGMPDWQRVWGFLAHGYTSEGSTLAVAATVCWLAIVGVVLANVVISARAVSEAEYTRRRSLRGAMFLAVGVAILGVGIARHNTAGYPMCCGSSQQSIQEAIHLVH